MPEALEKTNKILENQTLLLSPNPTNERFDITLGSGHYNIKIFDSLGKLIHQENTEGSKTIDVSHWQAGVYLIEVLNQNTKQQQHAKVIVQH